MYFLAKFLQAAGLGTILVGFIIKFPALMDMKIFFFGGIVFFSGWILQKYGLKR